MEISVDIRRKMYEALNSEDTNCIRQIVSANPSILEEGWSGPLSPSYLHLAARKGLLRVCETLVDLGIDVDVVAPNWGDLVPLEDAATSGHIELVEWLLERGAAVDGLPTSASTPLMGAAIEGRLAVAARLLEANAEINREHLRLPQTALDFAELFKVKNTGQDEVAFLLRESGGIRPYLETQEWDGVAGQSLIEQICDSFGPVNPILVEERKIRTRHVGIRRARVSKKYEYQFLFTVGLASMGGAEVAVCLPCSWPLNRDALHIDRFNWPLNLLFCFAKHHLESGQPFLHGDTHDSVDLGANVMGASQSVLQWLVIRKDWFGSEVRKQAVNEQIVIFAPVCKRPIKPGANALKAADKAASQVERTKWETLSIPYP